MNEYLPYGCRGVTPRMLTRRDLLKTVSAGFGWVALKGPAAHVQGGPAHMDTFDYKPKLAEDNGKPSVARGGGSKLFGSPFKFSQQGQSGLWISELFPNVAKHADQM